MAKNYIDIFMGQEISNLKLHLKSTTKSLEDVEKQIDNYKKRISKNRGKIAFSSILLLASPLIIATLYSLIPFSLSSAWSLIAKVALAISVIIPGTISIASSIEKIKEHKHILKYRQKEKNNLLSNKNKIEKILKSIKNMTTDEAREYIIKQEKKKAERYFKNVKPITKEENEKNLKIAIETEKRMYANFKQKMAEKKKTTRLTKREKKLLKFIKSIETEDKKSALKEHTNKDDLTK